MSSMSFIEQSQQTQRSQRTQSPTANILQAGSDCSCNSTNHSLIAQSQKVGCGCEEGGDNSTSEDSMPPTPVFETADGSKCRIIFIKTDDMPSGLGQGTIRYRYELDCYKDGGTTDSDTGGGSVGGGKGFVPASNFTNDPFDLIGTRNPTPPPKICLTCEILKSLYEKYKEEIISGKEGDYTREEKIAYQALFQFMSDAMKNIFDRVFMGDGSYLIGLENRFGENDDYYGNEYTNLRILLELTGNITPSTNHLMRGYFLNMLEKLAECPRQMTVSLGRMFNNTGFNFNNLFEMSTPNGYLDVNGPEKHYFVSETDGSSFGGNERTSYGSVFSIAQHARPDGGFCYSIFRWVVYENEDDAWSRQYIGPLV